MYNFIIVDDNEHFLKLIDKTVKNFFKQKGLECKTYLFSDYNEEFYKMVYTYIENKVYILDIETPSDNGINVAMKIRTNDFVSNIIFQSAYEEDYIRQILRSDVKYFSSFSKKDLEVNLIAKLEKLLKQNPSKTLRIRIDEKLYQIVENDIFYIKYENRKTIIKMKECELKINKQLNEIYYFLSHNFVYSHKSCIINMLKVIDYSLITKEINFEDKIKTDLLSRKYIKNLDDYYKIKD